jgi:hypothetical protein
LVQINQRFGSLWQKEWLWHAALKTLLFCLSYSFFILKKPKSHPTTTQQKGNTVDPPISQNTSLLPFLQFFFYYNKVKSNPTTTQQKGNTVAPHTSLKTIFHIEIKVLLGSRLTSYFLWSHFVHTFFAL